MIVKKDDRPPHGVYRCIECGTCIRVDDVNYLVSECLICKSHEYKKVDNDEQSKKIQGGKYII